MDQKQEKRRTENIANRRLFTRTIILLAVFGILAFIPILGKLWNLQITRHDELQEMAVSQQTSSLAVTASRGTIYDANGNVLAISSTAYDIIISPKAIESKQEELDQKKEKALEGGDNTAAYDQDVKTLVVTGMSEILGLDSADLLKMCEDTNSQYKRLASKVDGDMLEQVRSYIDEHDLTGCIYLQDNTKRYYPYSTLASQIIGFTNDSGGAYGLEAKFDEQLAGTNGLVVTAKNAEGTDLLNFFQDYYDAENGSNLHLTLDANIQTMCESMLQKGIEKYDVLDGGFIIVMKCDTGAILGMASSPTYDLNNYSTVIDDVLLEQVDEQTEEAIKAQMEAATQTQEADPSEEGGASGVEAGTGTILKTTEELYNEAYSRAVAKQWTNKAINDTYEPGSVFKSLVLAAALEEGVTNPGDSFYCSGSVMVADWPKPINCSNRNGHGGQTLAEAVGHSCNPAFIELGRRLGRETFYEYLEAFGIIDATWSGTSVGVDLPGEGSSIVWDYADFNVVELATASFGQRLNVTPIQLIAACNAVVNGGYYYTPHVVDYIEDPEGTITYTADDTPLRQVISESTSATCREMLEGVVDGMTGKNAYRTGYRIGGKTGTSQTLKGSDVYTVSFMGFAPADDPEIIVLVGFDHPEKDEGMYTPNGEVISGGAMAAPVAGDLIVSVLDYLEYGKQYSAEELANASVEVPNVVGYDLDEARDICEAAGFDCRVVGDGDDYSTVEYQVATAGSYIPKGSRITLYIGGEEPPGSVTVPDLEGLSASQAREELRDAGLYMESSGVNTSSSSYARVYSQSVSAGSEVPPGTVVTVIFRDSSDTEDAGGIVD